jgi:GT2 family glycosyltransferase
MSIELKSRPKVYIILVNWNGWKDTIECLESVFRLRYDDFRVLVCDNGSPDGSVEKILQWASGHLAAECENSTLRFVTQPPLPKPIPTLRITPGENVDLSAQNEPLVLIEAGKNLGFAGGNNIALRRVLAFDDFDYVWLLNNDTVVDPDALKNLVKTLESRPDAGLCGSTLLYYRHPETVQALGGSIYNPWTARVGHIGCGLDRERIPPPGWLESRIKYVVGASMLVKKDFIKEVGLMNEDYFLYFEEIDWASRGKERFRLAWSPESIVYHKEGASIGTARSAKARSGVSEMYGTRSRVLFTRRYYPYALPSVCTAILISALHRLLLGRRDGSSAILRGLISGLRSNLCAEFR